jgi:hypothetical protein
MRRRRPRCRRRDVDSSFGRRAAARRRRRRRRINGVGIARDLAGRGAKVLLCEKDDLAQHTSSSSTKLIHGGLRYLEYYEFSLVKKALAEREVLLKSAPHVMWPLRFVMPHDPSMRPVWMIRIGLFLYDHLARREVLPGSETVDLRHHPAGKPLKRIFTKGFVYSDGWVDDARLVVLNAIDAAEHGATVLTRWRCIDAQRSAGPLAAAPRERDRRTARGRRARPRQCGRAVGRRSSSASRRTCRARSRCASSRAATSSCRACSSTTTRTSSRTPTSGSSSRSRTRGSSR